MIKVENLTKSFGHRKVIDNVSFAVKRGEIAILLGPSGVGKSTILRLLNNLESIDSGKIFLDDHLLDLKMANKTHEIGMVFQQFNLFEHLSVIENISLPLEKTANKTKAQAKSIALGLLKDYGLEEKANNSVQRLSGGQKQRLALARTLALKPTIICFDEPTSALDPMLTAYVASSIKKLAHDGYIVLVSTHDPSLVQRLNAKMYLMDNGAIVEIATFDQLIAEKQAYPRIDAFLHASH